MFIIVALLQEAKDSVLQTYDWDLERVRRFYNARPVEVSIALPLGFGATASTWLLNA